MDSLRFIIMGLKINSTLKSFSHLGQSLLLTFLLNFLGHLAQGCQVGCFTVLWAGSARMVSSVEPSFEERVHLQNLSFLFPPIWLSLP